jgi:acetyl esterase/lipase
MPSLILHLQALIFRTLQRIFTNLDLSFSYPLPNKPSFTRTIPSTYSQRPGSIDLLFYTPLDYILPSQSSLVQNSVTQTTKIKPPTQATLTKPIPKRPLLINLHGGGFALGHARYVFFNT